MNLKVMSFVFFSEKKNKKCRSFFRNLTEISWSLGSVRPLTSGCCTRSVGADARPRRFINNVTARVQRWQSSTTQTRLYKGGYLSQSWNSSGTYINDSKAFLFRLQYNGSSSPLKFPVSDASKAGYGKEDYGPAFGSGNDIKTFSGQINCSGNAFNLNGSLSSLGVSYNLNGQNARSVLNSSLNVTDMEVYLVIGKSF